MFRNILVAIDGSRTATTALEEGVALARCDGARLVLISVAAPPRVRVSGPPFLPYPTEHDLGRAAREVVERAAALVPPDVPVTTVVRVGPAAAAIAARAEEGGHDLVVVGSHGRGIIGSFLHGSVSRAVVARSSVPVLVARRGRAGSLLAVPGPQPRSEVRVERATGAAHVQPEPATKGAPTVFLWLVAALLLELQLLWWIFGRMYEP